MTTPSIKEALELKPCPFCGKPPVLLSVTESDSFVRHYQIRCDNCRISLSDDYEDGTAELWNTRATLQPSGETREAIARIIETRASVYDGCNAVYRGSTVALELRNILDTLLASLASGLVQNEAGWRTMDTAPKDGTVIFVRRDNGCGTDYAVVWWDGDHQDDGYSYPWRSEFNAYVDGHWDEWMLPPIRSARDGGEG